MRLVEQHLIDKNDPRYAVMDEAAFKSKNLYNAALYEIRQSFIHEGKYLNYNEVQRRMQSHEAYKALPAKVSQHILMVLDRNWKSFFEALEAYNEDPSKFLGRPKLPKYKHKTEGRNILVYTVQAISKRGLKHGLVQPSMLAIEVQTKLKRGLYRATNGRYINADINGAGNIIRKVAPDAFQQVEGVEDGKGVLASLVVHPVRIVVPFTKPKASGS